MFCSKCGAELNDDANFCTKCGTKIKKETKSNKIEAKEENSVDTENTINENRGSSNGLIILGIIMGVALVFGIIASIIDEGYEKIKRNEHLEYVNSLDIQYYKDLLDYKTDIESKDYKILMKVNSTSSSGSTTARSLNNYFDDSYLLKFDEEIILNQNDIVLIYGKIQNDKYNEINHAEIISKNDSRMIELYDTKEEEYSLICEERKILEKQDFKEECSSVTYNDLFRNPEKYKTENIKANLYVNRIDVSASIFKDDVIYCSLGGNEIILYDDREVKEPKLAAGDSIKIYGNGYGNSVEYDYLIGSGLFGTKLGAEKKNEHYVPTIKAKYIEFK